MKLLGSNGIDTALYLHPHAFLLSVLVTLVHAPLFLFPARPPRPWDGGQRLGLVLMNAYILVRVMRSVVASILTHQIGLQTRSQAHRGVAGDQVQAQLA